MYYSASCSCLRLGDNWNCHRETLQQHAAFRQSSNVSSEIVELQERRRKALRQNEAFRELSEDSPVYSRQVYSVDSDQNLDEEFSDSENNGTSQVIQDPSSYWFDMSNQDTITEKILSDSPWTPEEITSFCLKNLFKNQKRIKFLKKMQPLNIKKSVGFTIVKKTLEKNQYLVVESTIKKRMEKEIRR